MEILKLLDHKVIRQGEFTREGSKLTLKSFQMENASNITL